MARYELIKKLGHALEADDGTVLHDGMLICPNCKGTGYVHPMYVGVAPKGDMEKLGFSNEIGKELSHGHRDKLVTLFECEMCQPLFVRVEVNHEGLLFSGVYLVKDNEEEEEDVLGDGTMMVTSHPENKLMTDISEDESNIE
jgi:hypothetical protein